MSLIIAKEEHLKKMTENEFSRRTCNVIYPFHLAAIKYNHLSKLLSDL